MFVDTKDFENNEAENGDNKEIPKQNPKEKKISLHINQLRTKHSSVL